jgi:lysophospholipase
MNETRFILILMILLALFAAATPAKRESGSSYVVRPRKINKKAASVSDFAPRKVACPATHSQTGFVRPASRGLSDGEFSYISERKPKTATALRYWINKVQGFEEFNTTNIPSVALVNSGGGYRAFLSGAGVIKGLDGRETASNMSSLSGLYQALTYHSGLSGGAWLLSSLAASNWQTVSTLTEKLWRVAFDDGLLSPGGFKALIVGGQIFQDVQEKDAEGFDPTLTDTWSRLLSYQLFEGRIYDKNMNTLSSIIEKTGFQHREVPYPIMTAVLVPDGQCKASLMSPMVEMHPYEWGSWDIGIEAFTNSMYLGTALQNGQVVHSGNCVVGYDNLGYIMGTSSNIFTEVCTQQNSLDATNLTIIMAEATLGKGKVSVGDTDVPYRDLFAVYPNPFRGWPSANLVKDHQELRLTDGGLTDQNNPIWPFIQSARAGTVDVLFVNDNSADAQHFPNGSKIYNTYVQAQSRGLTRMPTIPKTDEFVRRKYHQSATFFGCYEPKVLTIIYLPNVNYSFPSNQDTLRLEYHPEETDGMIQNGVDIANQGGRTEWSFCVACAIMGKSGPSLPQPCKICFNMYCYEP